MGSRLSPVLAGIFMEEVEEKALAQYPVPPLLYKRFVDDILVIWDIQNGPYSILLDLLNSQHQDINLTAEEEINGKLPFLDLLITRPDMSQKRPYSLEVYRKPTHGNRYIHFKSDHPFNMKKTVLRGLWLRAQRLLKNHPLQLAKELRFL